MLLLSAIAVFADDPPLITGQIAVFGSRITVSPAFIEIPSGIPVFINTTGNGINGVLKGELRGPSIPGSITFETVPGQPFQLPGLTTQGNYTFEDIRLMNGDQVVVMATPDHVDIHVIEILITSLSSRPLTLEEIRALGIVINEDDFSAVSFNIALTFNSQQIQIAFPMLMPRRANLQPVIPPPINGVGLIGPPPPGVGPQLPGALPYIVPMDFKPTNPEFDLNLPNIPGILVFPNEIAFLNQFFSVLLMVRNGASEGSELAINNLTSQIILDPDDVKLVRTNPVVPVGAPVPVRDPGADGIIGTQDDLEIILAAQTGQAEFFVEGLTEGTHIVRMNLNGILQGLAQGDVAITGNATGAILVRNPNFSLTFSHPSVVRAHEEYDLFVTITNTSTVDANLVRLTIPINALVNCRLVSDPFQEFETISSGESATAKFRLEPLVTGQVTAAVMTGNENVQGKFEFRVGVGEEGIPLSPNTLVLPEYANSLGPDFLEKALSFLGLAYSSATAPPGSLPPGVPYVSKAAVFQRAVEIAQGGQRFQIGESRNNVLSHLFLDLLGNSVPDQPIDQLRRTTQKGRLLLDDILRQMNLGSANAIAQHHDFADTTFFRNPYLSVMLNSTGTPPNLTITDSLNQSISSTGGEFGPYLGIPYSDLLRSEDDFVHWGIIGSIPPEFPTSYFYTINIAGNGDSQTLSLIVPFDQNFYKVDFPSFATAAGTNYSLLIDQQALNSGTFQIQDPFGAVVASAVLSQVNSSPTSIIAARQDAKADKIGHIVAVLFNRPLTEASAETLNNYFVEKNSLVDAQLQIGGRIVYLAFQNPISSLLDNDLKVSGVDPPLAGGNATVRIQTTVTTDAGRVKGKVFGAEGAVVAFAPMQLLEIDSDDVLGDPTLHVTATTTTNAQGEYEFDYVRKVNRAFQVRVQDPFTGDIASASSIISFPQQLINLDIVFLGRGTVQGLIYKIESGNVVAVEGALVQAVSLNEQVNRTALSDSNGHYSIPDVAVGNVNLTAQNQFLDDPEPFFGAASVLIPSAGAIADADIEVVSAPAGKVNGRILQANGIDPIINAYVLFSMDVGGDSPLVMATSSDENGWYGFDPVPAGLAQISARDTATGQTIGGTSINIPPGGNVTANIVAQGTGSIEVFLLLAPGMQLSDIGVYVLGTPFYQNPVQAVPVHFDGVAVGSYAVQAVNAETGQTVSGKVTIPFASATGSIILDFPDRGTIGGQIFNVDSTTAANSTVLLFGGILQSHLINVTTADSQGNYLFEDVDFETYRVHAVSSNQNDGGESALVTITEQNRNAAANVTFLGKGTVNVHVETSGGPAVVQVRLDTVTFDSDGRIRRQISYYKTTNTDGDTSFPNLFRGTFTVVVDNPGSIPAIVTETLDGPTKQVNILLSDNPSVSGVVHDANGIPTQAQVTYEQGNQTLTTDAQGQFSFVNIPQGPGTFTAAAAGSLGQVTIAVQQTNPFIDIHLLGFGNVFGMVKDGSGNPVANADVKITVPGLLQRVLFTETDTNGMYRFDAVPEESVAIEATNGVSAGRGGVKIIHNADVPLDITLTATGTVQGTVFKANGNTTIANAEVTLFRNCGGIPIGIAASDSNGDFQFLYVPVGSYCLAAIDKNTGRRGESASFKLTTDGETVDQDVLMEAQGKVHGVIYDYTGANPIAGANITLISHGLVNRKLIDSSGVDGSYNLPAVPQGTFTITATSDLLAGQTSGSIQTEDQDFTANILLEESASIEGTILFADQTPIPPGVVPIITLSGNDISSRIDAPAGEFHADDLPLGDYTLTTRFSYNGVPYRGIAKITLSVPGPNGLTMILKGLKTVNVTVLGSLLDVTTVTLTYNNDMEKRTETHAISGNTTSFLFVPESSFTITARTEDADSGAILSGSISGTIVGDGLPPIDLSVTVAPSGTVKGVVTDDQSNPVDGVSLTLTTGNANLFGFTDIAGNFQIDGVTPGNYTLVAEDFANARRARAFGTIAAEQINTHVLILDGILPSVVSTDPAKDARDIPFNSTIHVVFNELMEPSSIQDAFLLISPNGSVSGNLVQNGTEWIFTPSVQLKPQTTYTILISKTAEDLAGNTLADDYIATFTTLDNVIPTLINSIPVDKAFNVPTNTKLQLFFSETIQSSGTFSITRIPNGPPLTIADEKWNLARTSVMLTFSGSLVENERITFTITGFTDTSGNSNSASLFFDTIDTAAPADPVLSASANPIIEGHSVTITAAVLESPLTVDFYIKGILRFHDTTAPFVYNVPPSLTTIAANGGTTMLVEATATDRSGNTSGRTLLPITLIPDLPPQISIDPQPSPGDIFAGQTIRVNFTASDEGVIKKVLIIVSGALNLTLDAGQSTSGFKDVALPSTLDDGSVVIIKARATDDSGKSTSTPEVSYTIVPDTIPPTISITQPPGGTVEVTEGSSFAISVDASDNVLVDHVQFAFNGNQVNDSVAPYQTLFTAPAVDEDTTIIGTATAFDADGNSAQAQFTIFVKSSDDPDLPTIEFLCPNTGALFPLDHALALTVHVTDNANVQKVEFYRDDESTAFTVTDNISSKDTTVNASDSLTGLGIGETRQYRAIVYDYTGNSSQITVVVEIVDGNQITANEIISTNNPYQDETIIVHPGVTLTINGPHSFADIVVLNGGIINHSDTDSTTEFKMDLTANRVYVDCGAKIDTTGLGYDKGYTYPNSTAGGATGTNTGGSHGGLGLKRPADFAPSTYGSFAIPEDSGSGGGTSTGGGVIGITTNLLTVDGNILADGSGSNGGGAGGSIQINTQSIAGSGFVSAKGGRAGAGGRLLIHYEEDLTNGGITKHVIANGQTSSAITGVAGAGTIYLFETDASTYGKLIADNSPANNGPSRETVLPAVETGVILNTTGNVVTCQGDASGWTEFPHSVVGLYFRILNTDDSTFGEFKILSQSGNTLTLEGLSANVTGLHYRGVLKMDSIEVRGGAILITPDIENNQPPSVSITSPSSGTVVHEEQTIQVLIDAFDDSGINDLRLVVDGVPATSDTTYPYARTYTPPLGTAGTTVTIIARATDNTGNITDSAPILLNIEDDVAPVITLTSPQPNQILDEGTIVSVVFVALDDVDVIQPSQVTLTINNVAVTPQAFFDGTTYTFSYDYQIPYGLTSSTIKITAKDNHNQQSLVQQTHSINDLPQGPAAITSLDLGVSVVDIAVNGNYAYVTTQAPSLLVIDISSPDFPTIVNTLGASFDSIVTTSGNHLFKANRGNEQTNGTLDIYDLNDPVNPALLDSITLGKRPQDISVVGNYAYVCFSKFDAIDIIGDAGFYIVDISNPANLVLAGSIAGSTQAFSYFEVDVTNNLAVTRIASFLKIIDVSDPANPIAVSTKPYGYLGSASQNPIAYLGNDQNFTSVDFSNPGNPFTADAIQDQNFSIGDVEFGADSLALASIKNGFAVIDISDPSNLSTVSTILIDPLVTGQVNSNLVVEGDYVYAVWGRRLLIARYRSPSDNSGLAPTVNITSPADGSAVPENTTLPITVNASDDVGVESVQFLVDGSVIFTDHVAPYTFNFQLPGAGNTLTLGARARDFGGNIGTAPDVTIEVVSEQIPPSVSIISPVDGDTFAEGTSINVTVNATDNVAVASVALFVDGEQVGVDTATPYEFPITLPTGVTNTTLTAVATDTASNTATSDPVVLNVAAAIIQLITPKLNQTLEQDAEIYAMAAATSVSDFTDYYFLINGTRVNALPATKQGNVLRFISPFTVPATETITIEAIAVISSTTVSQTVQCLGKKRPDPFHIVYSSPADGESQVPYDNSWISSSISIKFSQSLNEAQDFISKIELKENGSAIAVTPSASNDILQIQASFLAGATYSLTVQNIESSVGEILAIPFITNFSTAANLIYVDRNDPGGVADPPCGLVLASPCLNITAAVQSAQPNDAILIQAGSYFEDTSVPIDISLNGINADAVSVFFSQETFGESPTDRITIRDLSLINAFTSNDIVKIYLSRIHATSDTNAVIDIVDTTGNPGIISILNSQITAGFQTQGIVLNLSGDQNTQIEIKDNQISADSGIGVYVDDLDDGGGMHATIERNRIAARTGIQVGDTTSDVLENQLTGIDNTSTAIALFPGKNFIYHNNIRGNFNSGISSFSTAFLSNNDLAGNFDSGITGFDTIHYRNAVHDSQFNTFGIVSYRGQVLSNQVINNNGNGSYLVDAIGGGNIFRKSIGLGIQQASVEFGFFEFNRIEACTAEGAFVDNVYGDFGGGIFGSRGGNVFLNNAVNLGNASSATIDARNNFWDPLPPVGTFGAMNTDPANVISPEPDPPDVSFITPTDGENISIGEPLLIRINATDATGVASLSISFDGLPVYQSVEPYEIVIPGEQIFVPGPHTITVEAFDVWNNQTTLTITVTAN